MPKNYKTVIGDYEFLPSTNKHRKINPIPTINFNTTTSTTTSSNSSAQEEEVVIVHLDFHFRSKLLINFYKNISKFKLNSNILNNNNIVLLNEIIYHTKHSQSIPPQLLYRGSRDGFKGIDFHSRCDFQGPTLTIIKSSEPYNQIFGGFTTQNWNKPISDSSAFIFKIDENNQQFIKFNIKQDQKQNAIFSASNCLPLFGTFDICIFTDCNLNNYSYSNFGFTYELPNNNEYEFGFEKAKNYLAGSYNFRVSEIEVFKIT